MFYSILATDNVVKVVCSAIFFTFIDRFAAVPLSRALVPAYSNFKSYQVTQWNSRVAAIINAVVVCPIALWLLCEPALYQDPNFGFTQMSNDLCCFAAGYFLWDLFMCIVYFKDYGIGFTLHAIFCLYTYLVHLIPIFQWYGMVFLLFELSTPFINLAWMMDKAGVKNAAVIKGNFALAVLTFFFVRIIFGTCMLARAWMTLVDFSIEGIPGFVRATCMFVGPLLGTLNFYWFYMIIQFALRQSKAPKKE